MVPAVPGEKLVGIGGGGGENGQTSIREVIVWFWILTFSMKS